MLEDDIDDLGNYLLSQLKVANYALFWLLDYEKAVSEISVCPSGVGCGTTTDDEEGLLPRKKRRKMIRNKAADVERRDHPDNEDKEGKGGKGRKKPQ